MTALETFCLILDMSAPADDGINVRTVYRTLRGVGEERQ